MTTLKRKALSLQEKIRILKVFDEKSQTKNLTQLAAELQLPVSTLRTILKNREEIKEKYILGGVQRKKVKIGKFDKLEKVLVEWLYQARASELPISGPIIREKARKIAESLQITDFNASNGWINRFKNRHCIVYRQIVCMNKKWKDACKNPKITDKINKKLTICSLHFEDKMYRNCALMCDALPTLNLPDNVSGDNQHKPRNTTTSNKNIKAGKTHGGTNKMIGIIEEIKDTKNEISSEIRLLENTAANEENDDDIESVTFSSSEDENEPTGKRRMTKQNDSEEEYEAPAKKTKANEDSEEDNEQYTIKIEEPDLPELQYRLLPEEHAASDSSEPEFLEDEPETSEVKTMKPLVAKVSSLPSIVGTSSVPMMILEPITTAGPAPKNENLNNEVVDECSEVVEDDCSTFAAHIKTRMRTFDPVQKYIAQKLISDIMFMASTKQLQLGTVVVHPATVSDTRPALVRRP